jgi:hypothetical protein
MDGKTTRVTSCRQKNTKKTLDNESDIIGHLFLKVKLQRGHLRKDGTSLQSPISTKTSSLQRRHISSKTPSLQ